MAAFQPPKQKLVKSFQIVSIDDALLEKGGAALRAHHEHKRMAAWHMKEAAAVTKSLSAPPLVAKSINSNQESVMSNTYEDLFKSELGIENEQKLIDCPHCDAPITKSEVIAKAKAATGNTAHDNKDGGHHHGPAKGKAPSAPRAAGAAKRHDKAYVGAHDAVKSDAADSSSDDDMDKAGTGVSTGKIENPGHQAAKMERISPAAPSAGSGFKNPTAAPKPAPAAKVGGGSEGRGTRNPAAAIGQGRGTGVQTGKIEPMVRKSVVTGSAFVQYVDDGTDEALAKSIAEGSLGQGMLLNQPIDKNTRRA